MIIHLIKNMHKNIFMHLTTYMIIEYNTPVNWWFYLFNITWGTTFSYLLHVLQT